MNMHSSSAAYPNGAPYSKTKKQFQNNPPTPQPSRLPVAAALGQLLLQPHAWKPPAALPMQSPDWAHFLQPSDTARYIWLGHSTVLARVAGQTVFIDPVFAASVSPFPLMMRRFQPPAIRLEETIRVDWVLISHNHYDHLDAEVIAFYRHQPTRFAVPLGLGALLQQWGIAAERIQELDWWQSLVLADGLMLTAVPARHNSGRSLWDYNQTLWLGYVMQTAQERIYFSGDTSFGDGAYFSDIHHHFGQCDIAFMENGQYHHAWPENHMTPEQTVAALVRMGVSRFVPVHWGAYALAPHRWDASVRHSTMLAMQHGITPITPVQGQVFDAYTSTSLWWENVSADSK